MNILIVGAGLAGLSAAYHLQKQGHILTIIEKANNLEQQGYILGVWSKLTYMPEVGIVQQMAARGLASQKLIVADVAGKPIRKLDLSPLNKEYGQVYIVNRTDLHGYLREATKDIPILFGTTVSLISENENGVAVVFSNGEKQQFDLVIGADGAHSAIRDAMFPGASLNYFGLQFWMYFAPKPSIWPEDTTMIAHNGKFFGVYPDGQGKERLFTIFALPAEKERLPHPELPSILLQESFREFGWIVPEVLASLGPGSDLYYDTTFELQLSQWHTRRVVLIGDAAHALVATASMGASMALEDAYVLADELKDVKEDELDVVLARYQERKQPRIEHIKRAARFYGSMIRLSDPTVIGVRNVFLKTVPQSLFLYDLTAVLSKEV